MLLWKATTSGGNGQSFQPDGSIRLPKCIRNWSRRVSGSQPDNRRVGPVGSPSGDPRSVARAALDDPRLVAGDMVDPLA
ncbi:MAG TPA: hypothetical protein PL151_12045, partial [Phycisphaerae bacterium]|nr:hypothetical protein [Phycisphaerae bacterium]